MDIRCRENQIVKYKNSNIYHILYLYLINKLDVLFSTLVRDLCDFNVFQHRKKRILGNLTSCHYFVTFQRKEQKDEVRECL